MIPEQNWLLLIACGFEPLKVGSIILQWSDVPRCRDNTARDMIARASPMRICPRN
jgi:hypothetical protein